MKALQRSRSSRPRVDTTPRDVLRQSPTSWRSVRCAQVCLLGASCHAHSTRYDAMLLAIKVYFGGHWGSDDPFYGPFALFSNLVDDGDHEASRVGTGVESGLGSHAAAEALGPV